MSRRFQPEGFSRGFLCDYKPSRGPSFEALMVTCSRDTVTATLTLSSHHSFFFLLCSMNYELEIFQLQHSTCFWNLTVGCEAGADGGLGAGAGASRRFIIILLSLLLLTNQASNLSKPLSSHAFLLSCFLNYSFYIFLLIPT